MFLLQKRDDKCEEKQIRKMERSISELLEQPRKRTGTEKDH